MGLLLATGALKKKEPPAPPPRSVLQEGQDTLDAYSKLLPQEFDIEAANAKRYAALTTDLVSGYGPELTESLRTMDPHSAALSGELNTQAMSELAAGSSLTPSVRRELEQYVRAGAASRGFGYGPSDLTSEVLTLGLAGQDLQARRRGFAQSVLGFNRQRSDKALGALTGYFPPAPSANPENSYTSDLFNTDFNAGWSDKLSTRNYNAAVTGALIGAIGQIVGGAGHAAAGACWVARSVFGERSALWRLFQAWLFADAPGWFRWVYLRYGERAAVWLQDKPRIKAIVRRWMLGRIWNRIELFKQDWGEEGARQEAIGNRGGSSFGPSPIAHRPSPITYHP